METIAMLSLTVIFRLNMDRLILTIVAEIYGEANSTHGFHNMGKICWELSEAFVKFQSILYAIL